MDKLSAKIVTEYQKKKEKLKTIGEFKQLGRELRDKYNLTDKQAIDLLNNKNVLEILAEQEGI